MKLIDADQAAEILGLENRMQVYDAARRGLVPSVSIGRRRRFDLEALKEWAQRGGTPIGSNQQVEARASAT